MHHGIGLLAIILLTGLFGCLWLFMNQNHHHHSVDNMYYSPMLVRTGSSEHVHHYINRLDSLLSEIHYDFVRNITNNTKQCMLQVELNKYKTSMNILSTQSTQGIEASLTHSKNDQLVEINNNMSDLLLVFTTCNHIDTTLKSLKSINKSFEFRPEYSSPPHIIIIDDASTDGTVPQLRELGYTVVTTNMARGLTYSWNLGFRVANVVKTYKYIVFMNNDVLIPRGSLNVLYDSMQYHEVVCPVTTLKGAGHHPPQALVNNFPQYTFEDNDSGILSNDNFRSYETFVDNPLNMQTIQDSLCRMRKIRTYGKWFKKYSEDKMLHANDFTIHSGVKRKTEKNRKGYFLYPKFNGFLFGINIEKLIAKQIPWDDYTFFDPSTVMVGQEDRLSTLLNKKGILPVIEPFAFMYHYKSVTVGKAKSLESNEQDRRDNLTHYHVDIVDKLTSNINYDKLDQYPLPYSDRDENLEERSDIPICIGIRTYPLQKYWIQSLISTLVAQYCSLEKHKSLLSLQVYVINTEPYNVEYTKYLRKAIKSMSYQWIRANCTVSLLADATTKDQNTEQSQSTRNAFYGYDMTDAMLQTMISNSKCEWLMFTNGDNVYNRAWMASIVDKMHTSVGSNAKNSCSNVSQITDLIGWDFVTHHPRRVGNKKGENAVQRTEQVISIQMKRRFVDLGSVIIRKALFQQQYTRQFTLMPTSNLPNCSSIDMELAYNTVRFMPDAIFTSDMFARDFHTIRTLISISNSNLQKCRLTTNNDLNNSGIYLIHQTLLFHQ